MWILLIIVFTASGPMQQVAGSFPTRGECYQQLADYQVRGYDGYCIRR